MTIEKIYNPNKNQFLEIKLDYRHGGWNYWYGVKEKRGYELIFSLIRKNGKLKIIAPLDGVNFRILVKEAKRYSSKTIEKLEQVLKQNQQELLEAYEQFINKKATKQDVCQKVKALFTS